jgi:hypothetical protein
VELGRTGRVSGKFGLTEPVEEERGHESSRLETDPVFSMTLSQQDRDYPQMSSLRIWYYDVF